MAKFLFLLTETGRFKELKYASCVAERIADEIEKLGHTVIRVRDPSPKDANDAIAKYKPDVVWWVGHGHYCVTTLKGLQVWIMCKGSFYMCTRNINVNALNNTIACALSCLTARELGPYLVNNAKCKAYLGYVEEFAFMWCSDPRYYNCACMGKNPWGVREELWKKIVESMHECNLYFVLGLAKGMTAEQANEYSLKRYDYWVKYFSNVKPQNSSEASVLKTAISLLKHDKKIQTLLGDKNAKVSKVEAVKMSAFVPFALIAIGSVINMLGGKKHA